MKNKAIYLDEIDRFFTKEVKQFILKALAEQKKELEWEHTLNKVKIGKELLETEKQKLLKQVKEIVEKHLIGEMQPYCIKDGIMNGVLGEDVLRFQEELDKIK